MKSKRSHSKIISQLQWAHQIARSAADRKSRDVRETEVVQLLRTSALSRNSSPLDDNQRHATTLTPQPDPRLPLRKLKCVTSRKTALVDAAADNVYLIIFVLPVVDLLIRGI